MALYFLAKYAKNRIVFSGLGADELFGGYRRHLTAGLKDKSRGKNKSYELDIENLECELKLDILRIGERNLARDDRVISMHSKEVRLPFLDENMVEKVTGLSALTRVRPDIEDPAVGSKFLLRVMAYWYFGLKVSAVRMKQAMQFGCRSAKAANREIHKSVKHADKTDSENLMKCLESLSINN